MAPTKRNNMSKNKKIWYTWEYRLVSGTNLFSGASYATISHALDAALYSANNRNYAVTDIEVKPAV
jgi:hypothetical protein